MSFVTFGHEPPFSGTCHPCDVDEPVGSGKRAVDAIEGAVGEPCASKRSKKPKLGQSSNGASSSAAAEGDTVDANEEEVKGARHCREPRCKKRRTHGPVDGTRSSAVYCGPHGKKHGYEDVYSAKCQHPGGCKSLTPCFGIPGGRPQFCEKHHTPGTHIDVTHKRCQYPEGCPSLNRSYGPVGGLPASGVVCATHGQLRGYEDVRSRKCEEPGCTSLTPTYGPVGCLPKSATHCSGHGRDKGYEDVVRKRCSCTFRNFVHPMSKVGKCTVCDTTLWPRIHKKEDAVAVLLQLAYGDQCVRRELAVSFKACGIGVDRSACGQKPSISARLDFVIESMTAVVIVEVDEFQHSSYCGEISRLNEIFTAFRLGDNIRHVHFVRFNPDAFKIDQKTGRVSLEVRHARLVEVIQKALDSHEPQKTWSILHVFYDTDENGRLCIMDEINMEIHPVFIPPIFIAPIIV